MLTGVLRHTPGHHSQNNKQRKPGPSETIFIRSHRSLMPCGITFKWNRLNLIFSWRFSIRAHTPERGCKLSSQGSFMHVYGPVSPELFYPSMCTSLSQEAINLRQRIITDYRMSSPTNQHLATKCAARGCM